MTAGRVLPRRFGLQPQWREPGRVVEKKIGKLESNQNIICRLYWICSSQEETVDIVALKTTKNQGIINHENLSLWPMIIFFCLYSRFAARWEFFLIARFHDKAVSGLDVRCLCGFRRFELVFKNCDPLFSREIYKYLAHHSNTYLYWFIGTRKYESTTLRLTGS